MNPQAMLDANGDGKISQQEFLEAAKSCLVAERAAAARANEHSDALRAVQRALQGDQVCK